MGKELSGGDYCGNAGARMLEDVRVRDAAAVLGSAEVQDAIEDIDALLEGVGQVQVQASKAEPFIRVIVDAPSIEECSAYIGFIVNAMNI